MLSIVVPCYNEQDMLIMYYETTSKIVEDIDTEFIFVNDGSSDNTFGIMKIIAESHENVHYISFSRNFGKEAAIYAGLKYAKGDLVVVMDADLQDPPQLIPQMIKMIEKEGYDTVGTRRVTRAGEPPIRSFFARRFYRLMQKISKTNVVDGARDFQMMKRKVVDAIVSMGEYNRFSKGIFEWVGFKKKWLEYENVERAAGETKWSFWSLVIYAIDGIIAFSTTPLVISSVLGILMCIISFFAIIFIIARTLIYGDPTSGWPSLACIIVFVSGLQLLGIGILGQYLAKTYLETKNRPIFIVDETDL